MQPHLHHIFIPIYFYFAECQRLLVLKVFLFRDEFINNREKDDVIDLFIFIVSKYTKRDIRNLFIHVNCKIVV